MLSFDRWQPQAWSGSSAGFSVFTPGPASRGSGAAVVPMFAGEITGVAASFPSSGVPQLTVTAQDRRHRMRQGTQAKWHNRPEPSYGNLPKDDQQVDPAARLDPKTCQLTNQFVAP